jgi:methanogen extracellular protein (TIGR04279 family)
MRKNSFEQEGKSISYFESKKMQPIWKESKPELKTVHSQVLLADALKQSDEFAKLNIDGANQIELPFLSTSMNKTFTEDHILVYAENQSINCTFFGPIARAGSDVKVCISSSDIAKFLSPSLLKEGNNSSGPFAKLNSTGAASFTVPGVSGGMYTLLVIDKNSSVALMAMPLLITPGNLTIQTPKKIIAGEVLKIKMNTTAAGNQTMIFAAVMISIQDYENASINLQNGTKNITLSLRSKSLEIVGKPSLSSDLLMEVMYLLPQNSAVGMQESQNQDAELSLITDAQWPKEFYILICVTYSPGRGLMGLNQEVIEVV